jgi:NADPH:quinone reductase-like Zn-dependent oxidoreductase
MHAAVLTDFGDPSVLRYGELPDPSPAPGEVVVELRTAALNRRDTYLRKGTNPAYRFPLPLVLGSDGAGVRRDTGEEVVIYPLLRWGEREEAPAPGYEILGGPSNGTYAELVAVPEENLYPKPTRLSWEEAAAFPLAGLTAYRALFSRAGLRAGETVLVLGAGSGVSTVAVSLAHQAGARVLVTSSSAAKIERARELGAEAGVDYTAGDWVGAVRELTGGEGVDVVIDSVGATWPDSLRCLRPGGRLAVFGATAGSTVELEARPIYFGQFSILGTTMGSPRDFAGLLRALEEGSWRPVIDSVRPLAEAAEAHRRMEAGEQFGKLVLATG